MRTPALVAFLPLLLCACAGPEQAPAGEVVKVEALPASHLSALEAYGRGGEEWEAMRARVEAQPELARFMVDNLLIEMVRSHEFMAAPGPGGERAQAAFSRARAELVSLQSASTPVLVEMFEVSDEIVASLVGETLVQIGRPAAVAAADLLFRESTRTQRRSAVLFQMLSHAGRAEGRVRGQLLVLTQSEDWFVRAEAALALGLRGGRDRETETVRLRLGELLFDEDPAVAEYAARGLGALDDPEAVLALIAGLRRAVDRGEVRVMRACQGALEDLTGSRAGDVAGWEAIWLRYVDGDTQP